MKKAVFQKSAAMRDEIVLSVYQIDNNLIWRQYEIQSLGPVNKVDPAPPGIIFGVDLCPALEGAVLTYRSGTSLSWETASANPGRWFISTNNMEFLQKPIHEDYLNSNAFTQEQKDGFVSGITTIDYYKVAAAMDVGIMMRVHIPDDAASFDDCLMWGQANPAYGFIGDVNFDVADLVETDSHAEWLT